MSTRQRSWSIPPVVVTGQMPPSPTLVILVFARPPGGWSGVVAPSAVLVDSGARGLGAVAIQGRTIVADAGTHADVFVEPTGGWAGRIKPTATPQFNALSPSGGSTAIDGSTILDGSFVYSEPRLGWRGTITPSAILRAPAAGAALSGTTAVLSDSALGAGHACPCAGRLYLFARPDGRWAGELLSDSWLYPMTLAAPDLALQKRTAISQRNDRGPGLQHVRPPQPRRVASVDPACLADRTWVRQTEPANRGRSLPAPGRSTRSPFVRRRGFASPMTVGPIRDSALRAGQRTGADRRAYPITMFDEAGKQKVRTQFRRLGCIMAAFGRSARMSPGESADVVIEMDAVNGELGPDFAALECPTEFVVGTGAHSGATEDEMRTVRAAVAHAVDSNKRVTVFATTPHKHTQILKKAPPTPWSPRSTTSSTSRRDQRSRESCGGTGRASILRWWKTFPSTVGDGSFVARQLQMISCLRHRMPQP
jgi:hypothetical protein